jgi:hypothetical protein
MNQKVKTTSAHEAGGPEKLKESYINGEVAAHKKVLT